MTNLSMSNTLFTNEELVAGLDLPKTILDDLKTNDADTYKNASNEYLNAVINKIGQQKVEVMESVDNPFLAFDGTPIAVGDTIETIGIGYIKGEVYNASDTNPFAINKPTEIKAQYASIKYKMMYFVTTYREDLRHAVLNEYGLVALLNTIVEALYISKDGDLLQAQIAFLDNAEIYANGIEEIVTGTGKTEAEIAKAGFKKLVAVSHDFRHLSPNNNKMRFKMMSCPDKYQLIIAKQSRLDSIDIDYLSGLFNISKANLEARIIPVRDFKVTSVDSNNDPVAYGNDIDFVILDSRGFDNHVALDMSGSIFNIANLSTNTFYHIWRIFGFKKWHNARAFKVVETATPKP